MTDTSQAGWVTEHPPMIRAVIADLGSPISQLYPLAKGNKMDLVPFKADSKVDINSTEETRQERRERRRRKKQEKIPQHGRSLAQVYKDAILKRLKSRTPEK